jgi:hypothetical protein
LLTLNKNELISKNEQNSETLVRNKTIDSLEINGLVDNN